VLSEQLLLELQKLDRTEKLRVVQLLVNQLALGVEQTALRDEANDAIWALHESYAVAETLQIMLDNYKRERGES
jgi:hypothetical protein